MLTVYERAKRHCHHNANRFLQLVNQYGGLQAAKTLLHSPGLSYGLTELWKCGRLGISMEALILQDTWKDLFSDEDRQIAKNRLTELGYTPGASTTGEMSETDTT